MVNNGLSCLGYNETKHIPAFSDFILVGRAYTELWSGRRWCFNIPPVVLFNSISNGLEWVEQGHPWKPSGEYYHVRGLSIMKFGEDFLDESLNNFLLFQQFKNDPNLASYLYHMWEHSKRLENRKYKLSDVGRIMWDRSKRSSFEFEGKKYIALNGCNIYHAETNELVKTFLKRPTAKLIGLEL